ncbi:hypothetical protein N7466_003345 [Penicillium verhagenii]|uniref:uncharacterized protein n=1 Tax=Penicillium verhagenii TaxID=1562060 RepID=UPI0025455E31|nr:uncharacterized protein N7466_003345 [Penicillium verhagenii]KAJ5936895.1 hypothetical protein N7466_003345 [Penicillium verhagenii]
MPQHRVWQADLFLLEHWEEDSPLSIDAQREEIFAKFVALERRDREPYRKQLEKLRRESSGNLPKNCQELLDRVRLPAERQMQDLNWVRTCYDPSLEESWAQIQNTIENTVMGESKVFNDPSLYDFGSDWEKIFLRAPQLLESHESIEDHEEYLQEALDYAIDAESGGADLAEDARALDSEDEDPWISFYSEYMFQLAQGRIYIVDRKTLSSKGRNAGKVIVVWFDECGRTIRYFREKVMDAAEFASLDPCYLKEYPCWEYAEIGESYDWGTPLGPPYGEGRGETCDPE